MIVEHQLEQVDAAIETLIDVGDASPEIAIDYLKRALAVKREYIKLQIEHEQ